MVKDYVPQQGKEALQQMLDNGEVNEVYDLIANPLHEELYKRQNFDFLDELPKVQQLVLSYDYIQTQALQGGFIQLIQNGYISLLVTAIEAFQELGIGTEMIAVLDDVLKVFVLNRDTLARETTVEEFGKLYEEFKEFEDLDKRFETGNEAVKQQIIVKYLEA